MDTSGDKLNFSVKVRGKKSYNEESFQVPNPLTRRHTTGKVAELWDLCGLLAPLVAKFKLDLHTLVEMQLDWDDAIPEELLTDWSDNFEMMKQISHLKFPRSIIPINAAGFLKAARI